ncbi:MAG TPA: PD-(D/E)XK nuclease family protein, partial [bacterium]|nr:PD-(D/E)XK nuclease family protein [bacterium]
RPFALLSWEERLGFDQALRSAGESLIFSYSEFSLDGRPASPSPWLDHLVAPEAQRSESELCLRPWSRSAFWEENLGREAARRGSPPGVDSGNLSGLGLETLLLEQMRAKPLSPTYLDNLAKCPWSFFARRHLKLAREPEEDLEIDPRRRGGLQHRLLEAAFADLIRGHFEKGGRPSLAQVEASLERVYAALAAETMEQASPIPPVLLQDQLERMREVARFLLNEEQECWTQAKQRLIPRHLEWSFGRGGVPPLEVGLEDGRSLPLTGQIDRIDQSEDGRHFLLIDYKSSRSNDLAAELRQGLSLQLWVYMRAVRQHLFVDAEALGGLYWDLKERSKNQGMVRRELYREFTHRNNFAASKSIMKSEEYDKVSHRLEEKLRSLLKRALSGDYSLDPEKCSGVYCDYFEICRYGNKPRN